MKYLLGLIRCFWLKIKYLLRLILCFIWCNKKPKEEIKLKRVVELPEEIIVEILLKLPFKYMIQFSCVSKKWRSLILHDPQFSKTHYKVASQQRTLGQSLLVSSRFKLPSSIRSAYTSSDPNFQSLQVLAGDHVSKSSFLSSPFKENHRNDIVQLLGSCNGLVCISTYSCGYTKYFIWNPSTGFVRNLSIESELERKSLSENWIEYTISGFGYVNATDDYKYVVFATEWDTKSPAYARKAIFSWRTKCWKSIAVPSNIRHLYDHPGIYLNEALHWTTLDAVENKITVAAIDLGKEEFRQMPLPPDSMNIYSIPNASDALVRLGDCLCLWRSTRFDSQFWIMREYNVPESWNLLYSFRTADHLPANVADKMLRPVFVTESGTFVLIVFDFFSLHREKKLIRIECYKENKFGDQHILEEFGTDLWPLDAIQYDQTLLSAAI